MDGRRMRLIFQPTAVGSGAFGQVFRALTQNEPSTRIVALKKIHITDYVKHLLLLHEAAALVRLRGHPSIPEVYGWGRSQYFEYLSMELLGPDLYWWFLRKKKPLTYRNLVAIACQMLDVLEHVHSHGIVHCDIKPPNIMLGRGDKKSQVFLADFGLCLPFTPGNATATTRTRGTPTYASINNQLHQALYPGDDLESLAYTLIELLKWRLPWTDCMSCDEVLAAKQEWTGERYTSWGCHKVFGLFVDYARGLNSETPDYALWIQRFSSSVDALPHTAADGPPYPYDLRDVDNPFPRVRTGLCSRMRPSQSLSPWVSASWPSVPGSEHGFLANSPWQEPFTLDQSSVRDEIEVVRQHLALIDAPPTTTASSLSERCAPEVMRGFDDPVGLKVVKQDEQGTGDSDADGHSSSVISGPVCPGHDSAGKGVNQCEVTMETMRQYSLLFNEQFRPYYDPEYDSSMR